MRYLLFFTIFISILASSCKSDDPIDESIKYNSSSEVYLKELSAVKQDEATQTKLGLYYFLTLTSVISDDATYSNKVELNLQSFKEISKANFTQSVQDYLFDALGYKYVYMFSFNGNNYLYELSTVNNLTETIKLRAGLLSYSDAITLSINASIVKQGLACYDKSKLSADEIGIFETAYFKGKDATPKVGNWIANSVLNCP